MKPFHVFLLVVLSQVPIYLLLRRMLYYYEAPTFHQHEGQSIMDPIISCNTLKDDRFYSVKSAYISWCV